MTNNIGVSSATSNFSSPVIKSFRVSQQRVRKGEPFQLEWKTEGADKVEIFRNGNLLTTVVPTVESIERKEFYDSDSDVVYQLLAHGGGSSARSEPVKVSLIREGVASKSNRWIGWVLGAVALLLIGWLVFTKFLGPRNENVAVAPVSAEEEPVRIVMLGHNTHGKSTLAAAIGKNLEKKSLIKPVTYGEISNPGTVEVQGVRVNAAILEWKDPRPFMLI
ncbi:MAG TPA: hypothetical protein VFZ52_01220, partial [Chryseolinea sp.]